MRLGDDGKPLGGALATDGVLDLRQHGEELHQRLGGATGFRDHQETGAREIEAAEQRLEGERIDII